MTRRMKKGRLGVPSVESMQPTVFDRGRVTPASPHRGAVGPDC